MKRINENQKITLTIGQLKRLVKESSDIGICKENDRDEYDEVVRCLRRSNQEYGERGTARFLINAFGYQEVIDTLTNGELMGLVKEANEDTDVFGIPGLNVSERDSYWGTPTYFEYRDKNNITVTSLANDVSHFTFVKPMTWDGRDLRAWQMLYKANSANPELFKKALLNVLNEKPLTAWWDDTVGKWETKKSVLRKKNIDGEFKQRDRDMFNGL